MAINKKMILTGVTCAAAAVCFGTLFYFTQGQGRPSVEYEKLTFESRAETVPTTEPVEEEKTFGKARTGETGFARTLLRMNADTVGWIHVPGTKVDYPVVQSEDNDYYLHIGFDHKPFRAGACFMDYRNRFGSDLESQSDNIIIYGHNMANNSMFGSLRRYRQDHTYYETNPFVELSSNFEHYSYVIFGLVITDGSASAEWRYWDMEEFQNEREFNQFIENVRNKSLVDIDVDVEYGDQLVTLSTCYSDADNSRFLVVARKIREGEDPSSFFPEEETTEASTEITQETKESTER